MTKKYKKRRLRVRKKTRFEFLEWFVTGESVAEQCHRSLSTVRRWMNGTPIPPDSNELLLLKTFGLLPIPEWDGFRVTSEGLKTPCGDFISIYRLRDLGFYMKLLDMERKHNEELLDEIRFLKKARRTGQHRERELTD